jgi:hypothetical protein
MTMEEPIARVEIIRKDSGAFTAIIVSETEGEKELTSVSLETLFREITMDLEFVAGAHGDVDEGPELSAEEEFENLEIQDNW